MTDHSERERENYYEEMRQEAHAAEESAVPDTPPIRALIAFVRDAKDQLMPQLTPHDLEMFSALLTVLERQQEHDEKDSTRIGQASEATDGAATAFTDTKG